MRWVRVKVDGVWRVGLLRGDAAQLLKPQDTDSWLTDLPAAQASATKGQSVQLEGLAVGAPVIRPSKILAIGLNYAAHAAESVSFAAGAAPGIQKWFNKQTSALNGPFDPVHRPKVSHQLDYEGELVVIIGRAGRHVPAERAMEIVAGFSCGCDYSVRDWQRASPTMIMGKGFDTHAPVGPYLVTPDEVGDWRDLSLTTRVNGEQRQRAKLGDMIASIAEQIAHLTAAFTLWPGDLIFTGTPAGVAAGQNPPPWLVPGDTVSVAIEQIGQMQQTIIEEPETHRIG
ncbi:MAG: fumarylacetoacetate hydrolase family protein [Pseudomonadota bacterium]